MTAGSDHGVGLVRTGRFTFTRMLALHRQCYGHKRLARITERREGPQTLCDMMMMMIIMMIMMTMQLASGMVCLLARHVCHNIACLFKSPQGTALQALLSVISVLLLCVRKVTPLLSDIIVLAGVDKPAGTATNMTVFFNNHSGSGSEKH